MATSPRHLPPMSLGRNVYSGRRAEPLSAMPNGIRERTVAPHGVSTPESQDTPEPRQTLHVALIISAKNYVSFCDFVQKNLRVVTPPGCDFDVAVNVLPDMDGMVNFDQYGKPTTITLGKVGLE